MPPFFIHFEIEQQWLLRNKEIKKDEYTEAIHTCSIYTWTHLSRRIYISNGIIEQDAAASCCSMGVALHGSILCLQAFVRDNLRLVFFYSILFVLRRFGSKRKSHIPFPYTSTIVMAPVRMEHQVRKGQGADRYNIRSYHKSTTGAQVEEQVSFFFYSCN